MFKKIAMFTVLSAFLLLVNPLYAQEEEKTFSFGAKAGWLFFIDEPLSDSLENNWTIGADVKMWFAGGLGIGAEIQYLSQTKDATIFGGFDVDLEYTQIPINVDLFYRMPVGDGTFYVGGGGSFVFTDIKVSTDLLFFAPVELSADATSLGFNGVAGFQSGKFFVEGQWLWAEADLKVLGLTVSENLQVGGPSIWVGYRF